MSSESLHEDPTVLSTEVVDRHRAISSIMEELEAVDWYDQRVQAASDRELAQILAHNRDEEKEHAAMAIEWLRRNDDVFDKQLRTYLFKDGNILAVEEHAGSDEVSPTVGSGSLGIGSLRST